MQNTPQANRLHIAIFGRRNAGKSSLINALTKQEIALVSEVPGTTTDPVFKAMEILPIGPCMVIDTAGIDDVGLLGELRTKKTREVLNQTDLGLLVVDPAAGITDFERELKAEIEAKKIPLIGVLNKSDLGPVDTPELERQLGMPLVEVSSVTRAGIPKLIERIIQAAPFDFEEPHIVGDLVSPGDICVLVVPIDLAAPKGRLILPQVQTLRDLLDHNAIGMVVKERELREALSRLKQKPKLVITDSQAFLKVAADTPPEVPLTSFSIIFARFRGDLPEQVRGALAVENLRPGDRVLIAEACSHHPIAEDIGRVKIPRWLQQYVGGKLEFDTVQGHDFPEDLSPYRLVIHCGACMWNRREMLTRILRCKQAGVPITNYGVVIAYSLGIMDRALQPFPAALEVWREAQRAFAVPPLAPDEEAGDGADRS